MQDMKILQKLTQKEVNELKSIDNYVIENLPEL